MQDLILINHRYQLLEKIGSGGMGIIYRAGDRLTGGVVALKHVTTALQELSFDNGSDSGNLHLALAREFQTLASLRHPHIIGVLDYGFYTPDPAEAPQPFYTMELLDAPRSILEAGEDQTLTVQIELLVQLLQALTYLHRRGIIHRDIKPDNVLVTQDLRVKTVDFGLSIARDEQISGVAGTLAYMAPEVLRGKAVSVAADLYAVGVIAYQVLLGRFPYDNSDANALLNDILNATPDTSELPPALREVLDRLLAKSSELRYADAPSAIAALSSAVNLPPPPENINIRESFLQSARFIGRESEMAALNTALDLLTEQSIGSGWLVGGESGVGKTRLLDELRARALVQGIQVVRGQGVSGGGLPYQLLRDVIRRLVLSTPVSDLEASVLKEAVPDIHITLGVESVSDAPPLDGAAVQQRLALTVLDLLRRQSPTLMILEDLQWASEGIELLKQITPHLAALPVMIIGSYRHDERADLPSLLPTMSPIKLARLNAREIADLSASMLGESGEQPHIVDLLRRETEGNAFFLIEIVRTLAEDAGSLDDVGKLTLPPRVFAGGVQRVIQRRIEHVPEWALPFLQLAAVAGRQLDLNVLRAAFAGPIEEALLACSDAAVLEVQEDRWLFGHDKLREAVLDALEPSLRAELHREIAQIIERIYPAKEEWAAVLARHWRAGGDPENEAHYTRLAADHMVQVGALREAQLFAERALVLSHDQPAERARLEKQLGDINLLLSEFPQAVAHYESALSAARTIPDYAISAAALAELAWVLSQQGKLKESYAAAEDAVQLARLANQPRVLARALNNMGIAHWQQGNLEEANRYYAESLAMNREINDQQHIARALNNLGWIAKSQGNLTDALENLQESRAIFRQIGARWFIGFTTGNIGDVLFALGDYTAATQHFEEALALFHTIGSRRPIVNLTIGLSEAALMRGDVDSARSNLPFILREAGAMSAVPLQLSALALLAEIYLAEGKAEAATELVGLVLAHPSTVGDTRRECETDLIPRLQERLSPEQYTAAFARGEKLTLEGVVADITESR